LKGGKRFAPTGNALNQACQGAGASTFGFERAPPEKGRGMGAICLIELKWGLPSVKSSRTTDILAANRKNSDEIAVFKGREWMDGIALEC
jgi:hypothetical protein